MLTGGIKIDTMAVGLACSFVGTETFGNGDRTIGGNKISVVNTVDSVVCVMFLVVAETIGVALGEI